MEKSYHTDTMYLFKDTASNNISDRGLKHLSLGDWQELAWIDLSTNHFIKV